MKKCPYCAEEIQDAAIVCKHCGRDLLAPAAKPVRRAIGRVMLAGLGIIVAILVLGFALSAGRQTVDGQRLKVSVSRVGATLAVQNNDRQDWRNVRVEVNDRFRCRVDVIESGQRAGVPLSSCVADSGDRFNPAIMAPVNVYIKAVLADDTGEASNLLHFEH